MNSNALARLRASAAAGDVAAQTELASRLATGDGLEEDLTESFHWYGKAADLGSSNARFNLALMAIRGEGCEQDVSAGIQHLRTAAAESSVDANLVLAEAYTNGLWGLPEDSRIALAHLVAAARLGSSKAIRMLGDMLVTSPERAVQIGTFLRSVGP